MLRDDLQRSAEFQNTVAEEFKPVVIFVCSRSRRADRFDNQIQLVNMYFSQKATLQIFGQQRDGETVYNRGHEGSKYGVVCWKRVELTIAGIE